MLGGSIIPGMTLELSGPPGGGKTAIAVGIGLSARLRLHVRDAEIDEQTDGSNMGEVLIVGKLSVIVLVKAEKARRIDTEGGITPDRVYKAAVSLTLTSSGMVRLPSILDPADVTASIASIGHPGDPPHPHSYTSSDDRLPDYDGRLAG